MTIHGGKLGIINTKDLMGSGLNSTLQPLSRAPRTVSLVLGQEKEPKSPSTLSVVRIHFDMPTKLSPTSN